MKGATLFFVSNLGLILLFQSTHPWRVRLGVCNCTPATSGLFQSTHPWRVRLQGSTTGGAIIYISIHAPTRGATTNTTYPVATQSKFQSTHPWRVRHFLWAVLKQPPKISIHAPTGSATQYWCIFQNYQCYFNPRTHEGCDIRNPLVFVIWWLFQSTHPRRVRRLLNKSLGTQYQFQSTHPRRVRLVLNLIINLFLFYFNPRTHEGCDL